MNSRKGRKTTASRNRRNIVVFDLAGAQYAVPSADVAEVVHMPMLSQGAGLPSILEGTMNLDGAVVPVLRLDRLFGLSEKKSDLYTPLLVIGAGASAVALLVDRVREVLSVSISDVMAVQGQDAFNGCIEAEVSKDGETIHLLSVERILLEREQKSIAEFQAMEQERINGLEAVSP